MFRPSALMSVLVAVVAAAAPCSAKDLRFDLTTAVVVTASHRGIVEVNACRLLVEEAAKRCGVTMKTATKAPITGPVIYLGTRANTPAGMPAAPSKEAKLADGYMLRVGKTGGRVVVTALGNDSPGCVYVAGRLLREMWLSQGKIEAPALNIVTVPAKPIRCHQLSFRPKSNTYDKWGPKEFEQYVRDMAVWGTSGIELIPIEAALPFDSTVAMNVKFANIIASYGMKVWFWYPNDDIVPDGVTGNGLNPGQTGCPSRPDGRKWLLDRRRKLFQQFKQIDAVFIPGGDPDGCHCDLCRPWVHTYLPYCADIARVLRESHPKAQVWISNQGFKGADNEAFYSYLTTKSPKWLSGVVYGPWAEETIASMREQLPKQYPLRQYPDITHTARCQFAQPDWDIAFSQMLGREPIAYRVTQEARIAKMYLKYSIGAGTYSDGVNDDYHKIVWSVMLWDPNTDPLAIAHQYSRYFFGAKYEADGVEGIIGLERNWKAPLLTNQDVARTYAHFQSIVAHSGGELDRNWRFQMALLRAVYDRFAQLRLQSETAAQDKILNDLAADPDPIHAVSAGIDAASAALARKVEPEMQQKLWDIGQVLLDTIGMQLSVDKYGASAGERGAVLDYLDTPISNLDWIRTRLNALGFLSSSAAVRKGIDEIVNWENPGPGGFYDDLGNPTKQPHLVVQLPWADDPGCVRSTQCGYRRGDPGWRMSWLNYAETLYGVPIIMHYDGLDPSAQYTVRVMYTGRYSPTQTLTANDKFPVHGEVKSPEKPKAMEWPVPKEATASGKLTLRWDRTQGRGAQVSEVWLIKH